MELREVSEVKLFDRYGRCVGTAVPKSLTINSMGDIDIECSHLYMPSAKNETLGDIIGGAFNRYSYTRYDTFYRPSAKHLIWKVIFNDPATIVLWADGSKTVVKCGEKEAYDPEKGLAMALAKKFLGNEGNYYNIFKKWLPKEGKDEPVYLNLNATEFASRIDEALKRISKGLSEK